jgi:hypothetical protein
MYVTGDNQIYQLSPNGTVLANYTVSNSSYGPVEVDVIGNRVVVLYFERCALGSYCINDSSSAVVCPRGFYCPLQYVYRAEIIHCAAAKCCPGGTLNPQNCSSSSTPPRIIDWFNNGIIFIVNAIYKAIDKFDDGCFHIKLIFRTFNKFTDGVFDLK